MNYTSNYNLNLPQESDFVRTAPLNTNFTTIDTALKENAEAIKNVKVPTDQTYNPKSANPQSGIAVAEAISNAMGSGNIQEIEKSVNKIKEAIPTSINLYNVDANTEGVYISSSGVEVTSVTSATSDYIFFEAGKNYYITMFDDLGNKVDLSLSHLALFYADDKTKYKTRISSPKSPQNLTYDCYVRLCGQKTKMKYIVVSEGVEPTEYQPYYIPFNPSLIPTDKTFSPTSGNPQSGVAVAEAIIGMGKQQLNYRLSFPIFIPPFGGGFPEISTTEKTLTFPNDTILINDRLSSGYVFLQTSLGNTSVTWGNEISSTNILFYYDITNNKIIVQNYNDYKNTDAYRSENNLILLCTLRNSSGNKQACSSIPIYVDGKLSTDGQTSSDNTNTDNNKEVYIYENDNVKSVNHRGYNSVAPENTLSAYRLSKQKGFKYVECDVQFTADGVPVLLHDTTIDRTSNGTGNLAELTYDYVRSLDFGSWKSSTYSGEKIPHFEEFILLCKNLGLHPYIEPKMSLTNEQVEMIFGVVKNAGMKDKVTWISFSPTHLGIIKELNPNARLGYVADNISSTVIKKALDLKTDTNEVFIDVGVSGLTNETVEMCINADIPLETWTVNTEDAVKSLHSYVSGVTSDKLMAGRILIDANIE